MNAMKIINLIFVLMLAGWAAPRTVTGQATNSRTITGQIVYGDINNDIGELTSPTNFISPGDPIKHVWVEFNDGATLPVGDHDITNDDGRFSITFRGTPNLTLVTKAKNDYVKVKEHKGYLENSTADDVLRTYKDISNLVDYNVCQEGETCDIGTITVVSDMADFFYTAPIIPIERVKNYISRAFYITSAAHASGTNVERVHGSSLPGDRLTVRLGLDSRTTPWYQQFTNTIYLQNTDAVTFWHEYGHFVEDKIGAFALIPPFVSHEECTEITDAGAGNDSPNLCWSYLEGLATWFAALDASEFYGSYITMTVVFDGENDTEDAQCSTNDIAQWTDPLAVESVVSNVLWDLIDDVQDPANTSGVDEVAVATPEEVLAVITASMSPHTTCSPTELNSHPMGLLEFWDEWRNQHPGVVPDLYAAYAFNGADLGNATDVRQPDPVTLSSPSHAGGGWSNDPSVTLTITDGSDDVSGSYYYFVEADQSYNTSVSTSGPEIFTSTATVNRYEVVLPDGAGQYIHVNTMDMAEHLGTATTHYGPIHVDTVDPYMTAAFKSRPFRIDPTVPAADPTLVLGYPAELSWASHDDLSGVAEVRITFHDLLTGFSKDIHTTANESGAVTWFVDDVPATPSGELIITVTDLAGNDIADSIPAPVVTPFTGGLATSLGPDTDPCEDGRVISADLHNDGFDDVVLVCRWNQNGHLYALRGTSNGLARAQDFLWRPADDLTAADLDQDGDLDVVTVSLAAPGVATVAEILYNDGTGTLVDPGIALPLGALDRKTVRLIHPYDRKSPVLAVFGVQPGVVPAILAFNVAAGFTTVTLPGVDPIAGDWEAADMNSDGYVDLVALGFDNAGVQALSVFSGSASSWARQNTALYGSVTKPDLDIGDFDADGKPDIFVMFEAAGQTLMTKLLQNSVGGFTAFAKADSADQEVADGDGFIIDTANDARAEVIAMGRTATNNASGWYLRNDALVGLLQDITVTAMHPLTETDSAWGDFDADGDLDLFQLGQDTTGLVIGRYENQLGTYIDQNDAPKPPTNLSAVYDAGRGGYTFSWSAPVSSNDETPVAGFGYELRVGTTQNGVEILSWAHPAGASQQGHRLNYFVQMPQGSYWYDVRTVDSGWLRSPPAGAKSTP